MSAREHGGMYADVGTRVRDVHNEKVWAKEAGTSRKLGIGGELASSPRFMVSRKEQGHHWERDDR